MAEQSQAQLATKRRCRGCFDNIVQLQPGGRWRDTESESAYCAPYIEHEPMPDLAPVR